LYSQRAESERKNRFAPTLTDVVLHYEKHLGFVFTDQERGDLVAFLNAF